ncbi:hypothetical protein VPH35_021920 [Triticum aestivum]|uniref:Uncharacterized protein n=1 Tax=Triticum turgidum subsp. durum TaxID=4567 RepID=A0A9R1NXY1_TRITD|nr:unnamed protein product [Triticum turgidum subsp. durum]
MLMVEAEEKVSDLRQGELCVMEYVAELQHLWADLDHYDPLDLPHAECISNMKGSLGAVVKLPPCDHEVTGSSPGNSLLQKCRERLRTLPQTLRKRELHALGLPLFFRMHIQYEEVD